MEKIMIEADERAKELRSVFDYSIGMNERSEIFTRLLITALNQNKNIKATDYNKIKAVIQQPNWMIKIPVSIYVPGGRAKQVSRYMFISRTTRRI